MRFERIIDGALLVVAGGYALLSLAALMHAVMEVMW